MFKFNNPYFLLLILVVLYIFFQKRSKHKKGIKIPSIMPLKNKIKRTKKHLISKYFLLFSLILMIIALARPQMVSQNVKIKKDAIDMVISLDLSKSMEQVDFKPNRLEKAKEILKEFVAKRSGDRVSLVVFGGDAYTKVPLTFDHSVIQKVVGDITTEDITSNDRTAIGMGLGVAINRLKESSSKSKVIILLTDGENNSGEMSPVAATKIAKELGIKVYTVGIGAREMVIPSFFGNRTVVNRELDENLLEHMASETGGKYFRASNPEEFKAIFVEIDKLEKTEIEGREYYEKQELYENLLKISLILLAIALGLQYLIFIKIP
ncbi:MAG: vWA domain-containing protein [Fusobacteriaceae bacterium]